MNYYLNKFLEKAYELVGWVQRSVEKIYIDTVNYFLPRTDLNRLLNQNLEPKKNSYAAKKIKLDFINATPEELVILLKNPVVVERVSTWPQAAIKKVIASKNQEAFRLLLAIPAVIESEPSPILIVIMNALKDNNIEDLNRLLEIPAVINHVHKCAGEAVMGAVIYDNIGVLNRLLDEPSVIASAPEWVVGAVGEAASQQRLGVLNTLLAIPAVMERVDDWAVIAVEKVKCSVNVNTLDRLLAIPAVLDRAEDWVVLAIIDAGPPVAPNKLNRLLEIDRVRELAPVWVPIAVMNAVNNRNLAALNHLLGFEVVRNNITFNQNQAFRTAAIRDGRLYQQIANRLLQIPAVEEANRLFLIVQNRLPVLNQVETHSRSIHASVSMSAKKLQKKYGEFKFNKKFSDMTEYLDDKNIKEVKKLIYSQLHGQPKPNDEMIRDQIEEAVAYVQQEISGDKATGISVAEIFKLLLIGINKLENDELKKDAYFNLCSSLYLLKTEYSSFSKSCPPGFFNGLVYSQVSILTNEISMNIQTPEFASAAMHDGFKKFVLDVIEKENHKIDNDPEKLYKIATELAAANPEILDNIARNLIKEFYVLCDYGSPEDAEKAIANKNQLAIDSVKLFGAKLEVLLDDVNFYQILNEYNKDKESNTQKKKFTNP